MPSAQPTRLHTVVIDRSGATTNINVFAPELSAAEWRGLCASTLAGIRELGADWLLVGGSIPWPEDAGMLRGMFAAAREAGARVRVDTSGSALRRIIDDAADLIDLVGPHLSELQEATGADLRTREDVADTLTPVDVALEAIDRRALDHPLPPASAGR